MMEYRAKNTPAMTSNASKVLKPGKTKDGFINLGLPSHLAMSRNKGHLAWLKAPIVAPTVDDEYHRYAYAQSPEDVNILRFWEVCHYISAFQHRSHKASHSRAIEMNSQQFLRSPWTIYPFKHRLFPVNEPSHLVGKQIPRVATGYLPF